MISSRILLSTTAAVLAAGGLALLFAPEAVLGLLGHQPFAPLWPMQMLAAAWLGFAILAWVSRGSVAGGIYGRPVVLANLAHFMISALVLVRSALDGRFSLPMGVLLAVTAVLATAYGWRLFQGPPERELTGSHSG